MPRVPAPEPDPLCKRKTLSGSEGEELRLRRQRLRAEDMDPGMGAEGGRLGLDPCVDGGKTGLRTDHSPSLSQ